MTDFRETAVGYLNIDSYATFSSSEQKWINKILKLCETHPNEITIEHEPESNNGMLVARIPKSWLKVSPPRQREMTDEQREAAAIRLAEARSRRNG